MTVEAYLQRMAELEIPRGKFAEGFEFDEGMRIRANRAEPDNYEASWRVSKPPLDGDFSGVASTITEAQRAGAAEGGRLKGQRRNPVAHTDPKQCHPALRRFYKLLWRRGYTRKRLSVESGQTMRMVTLVLLGQSSGRATDCIAKLLNDTEKKALGWV